MSDEKKKCSGCGREVTGDIGWCMSCRSILYTDLLISRTDFSGSQFKTLVFPVRDIIWMQDRIRLREAELKAADDTNDMIAAELARLRAENTVLRDTLAKANELHEKTIAGSSENERAWTAALAEAKRERDNARAEAQRLQALIERRRIESDDTRVSAARWEKIALDARADLAEARADVARFEAALDVANRELAEARREQSIDAEADVLDAIQACVELADKAAQLEAKQFAGVLDCAIADNWRDIRDVHKWLSDQDAKRSGNNERSSRRTIRALVVAARVARLAAVGFAFIAGIGPRRVHDEIRFGIKQAKQQADRQAGKE